MTERSARPGIDRRWDRALEPLLADSSESLWRRHSDAVNEALFRRWLDGERCADALKTDLYDEAMGAGLYPMLAAHAIRVAAIDVTTSVLAAARARHPGLLVVAADARRLPFADGAFDLVVSNSTLDHFDARNEILAALHGIHRVLRSGGRLLLTMDNAANPAVALRNMLPFSLLRRVGLVAYPIGATGGPRRLSRMVRAAGFEVQDTVALLHCPRAPAIALARRRQRRGSAAASERFLERAMGWER
ncbi:MAG TPA: methyltransferase domain-containing protein, partial [Casimicrobiaceae bacterium]|nr:methyltransferase domain-containing protein [Casimicrobiaceae bacterium]